MSLLAKHVMLLRTVATWPARLPRNCELLCRHANVAISSRMQLQSTLVNKCNSTCVEQSNEGPTLIPPEDLLEATDPETWKDLAESFRVYRNFVTEDEEKSLFDEVEPYLKRLKYETSHWDDAINGYRETERKQWTKKNQVIIQRLRSLAFPPDTPQLAYVHVLDVMASGAVRAHVDSVRFCGNTISGICLLSTAVMRMTSEKDKSRYADILLPRRGLYIMQGRSRYDYAHEVLDNDRSKFRGKVIPRERRISIICRNEPPLEDLDPENT